MSTLAQNVLQDAFNIFFGINKNPSLCAYGIGEAFPDIEQLSVTIKCWKGEIICIHNSKIYYQVGNKIYNYTDNCKANLIPFTIKNIDCVEIREKMLKYNNTFFEIPDKLRYRYPKLTMKRNSIVKVRKPKKNVKDKSYIRIVCENEDKWKDNDVGYDQDVMYIFIHRFKSNYPSYQYKFRYNWADFNTDLCLFEAEKYNWFHHLGRYQKLMYDNDAGLYCKDSDTEYYSAMYFDKHDNLIDFTNSN